MCTETTLKSTYHPEPGGKSLRALSGSYVVRTLHSVLVELNLPTNCHNCGSPLEPKRVHYDDWGNPNWYKSSLACTGECGYEQILQRGFSSSPLGGD